MIRKHFFRVSIGILLAAGVSQTAMASDTPSFSAKQEKQHTLLLPAVQKARPAAIAPRKNARTRSGAKRFTTAPTSPAADTTCSGVNSCNDMIATCISLGGNVTPTSYDPKTGAPNGATCYSPN